MDTPFFNAHHSPIGAFASFTLGMPGANGGLGLELGRPANENVYIGAETRDGGTFEALPFFQGAESDEARRYVMGDADNAQPRRLNAFPHAAIRRQFELGTDTWQAGDLTFRVFSPARPAPEPGKAPAADLKLAYLPAVLAELTLDNRQGTRPRKLFFGWQGADTGCNMRHFTCGAGGAVIGVGQGNRTAIASMDPGMDNGTGFSLESVLAPSTPGWRKFGLGGVAALVAEVPAGEQRSYTFAICFHRGGNATAGLETTYWYTRWFRTIEQVAVHALANAAKLKALALADNARVAARSLNPAQQFQLIHAVRSYYGSTEFLERDGQPFWVVNEGEYRMMNTFDLTVDQLFFELELNPWTVRNELDFFTARFSYQDRVRFPKAAQEYPGGISFTHDMGIGNCVSRPGYSSYEVSGLEGCFSYMTHEQLVNWVLCATTYAAKTGDRRWLKENLPTLEACLRSMVNRDHPEPAQRDGIMSLDSSRCAGGAEITTYDSLDTSLGQARHNLYLAVKCWAGYVAMESVFSAAKNPKLAALAGRQADLCAATITAAAEADGLLPAILGEGVAARLIPAVEGLAFPLYLGNHAALDRDGRFGPFLRALEKHLAAVLQPGVCLFADGGWKLSSSSINSWLSKIYLCQYVARKLFALPAPAEMARADGAHAAWLQRPENGYWCWSDQMYEGTAKGSKYYPRGVTAWLWLLE